MRAEEAPPTAVEMAVDPVLRGMVREAYADQGLVARREPDGVLRLRLVPDEYWVRFTRNGWTPDLVRRVLALARWIVESNGAALEIKTGAGVSGMFHALAMDVHWDMEVGLPVEEALWWAEFTAAAPTSEALLDLTNAAIGGDRVPREQADTWRTWGALGPVTAAAGLSFTEAQAIAEDGADAQVAWALLALRGFRLLPGYRMPCDPGSRKSENLSGRAATLPG